MDNFQETELKLSLLESEVSAKLENTLKSLKHLKTPMEESLLESVYYDTANHALLAAGWTYRIRKEGDKWTATVKGMGNSDGGLHQREEWNVTLDDPQPLIETFAVPEIQQTLMDVVKSKPLKPLMETKFTRKKGIWEDGEGNSIEVALDVGRIEAGGSSVPIHELELELEEGKTAALLDIGKTISDKHPMKPEKNSKFFRGLLLAGLANENSPSKSKVKSFPKLNQADAPEGFIHSTAAAMKRLINSLDNLTEDPDEPEHLHQLRVSIRNLRSVLFLFKPLMEEEQHSKLNKMLREWSRETNELRELDMMWQHLQEWIAELENPAKANKIIDEVKYTREDKRRILKQEIAEGKMTPKLLDAWCMMERMPESIADINKKIPVDLFVENRLKKQMKRFNELAKKINFRNREELHQLRIRGKKIRYGIENTGMKTSGINTKKSGRILKVSKKLQDLLGDIHDCHCEMNWMRLITSGKTQTLDEINLIGQYEGWQLKRIHYLEEKLEKFWEEYEKKL
ncbi:MAG: CHAD domain-containing protein [Tindallia sp. MSAO_Bac2]|nr:MAG: CHAD domain-containing protein [Tindallia sp. MSAO_Bac2]